MKHALAVMFQRLSRTSGKCAVSKLRTVSCSKYCRTKDNGLFLFSLSSRDGVLREALRVKFECLGFSKYYVRNDDGYQAELYKRSPQEAIKEQI